MAHEQCTFDHVTSLFANGQAPVVACQLNLISARPQKSRLKGSPEEMTNRCASSTQPIKPTRTEVEAPPLSSAPHQFQLLVDPLQAPRMGPIWGQTR